MSSINALLKRREKLEQKIAAAQRLEKRKVAIIALLEMHGLLDLFGEQILSHLRRNSPPPVTSDAHRLGA